MGMGGQPVKGNVEKGIVIAGLMRDRHVDAHAVIQEGIGRVPVIIAEVPAGVLAQHHDEAGPEQDRQAQKQRIPGG